MRFACAFDHAGVSLRDVVFAAVREAGHEPIDLGTDDDQTPRRLPRSGAGRGPGDPRRRRRARHPLLRLGRGGRGGGLEGRGDPLRHGPRHLHGRQCVEHDDVNVLALGARVIGPEIARELVIAFAGASFSGEERHVRRLAKVDGDRARRDRR